MSKQHIDLMESDFIVVKEDFSRYLVEDGTILRAKIVLRKVFRSPLTDATGYPTQMAFDSVNVVSAFVPQPLKRTPSDTPADHNVDKSKELKFTVMEEKYQEYLMADGFRVTIKPTMVKVFRYEKYNDFGEPVYSVNLQAITNVERMVTTGS